MEISLRDLLFKIDIMMRYYKLDFSMPIQKLIDCLAEDLAAANPVDEDDTE